MRPLFAFSAGRKNGQFTHDWVVLEGHGPLATTADIREDGVRVAGRRRVGEQLDAGLGRRVDLPLFAKSFRVTLIVDISQQTILCGHQESFKHQEQLGAGRRLRMGS
jgi:hypothetical protein